MTLISTMTTISQHSGLDFGRAMGPALFGNDQSAEKGVTAKNSFATRHLK